VGGRNSGEDVHSTGEKRCLQADVRIQQGMGRGQNSRRASSRKGGQRWREGKGEEDLPIHGLKKLDQQLQRLPSCRSRFQGQGRLEEGDNGSTEERGDEGG
jgi:hypothetical protein